MDGGGTGEAPAPPLLPRLVPPVLGAALVEVPVEAEENEAASPIADIVGYSLSAALVAGCIARLLWLSA